ncbi:MAG: isochorismatase family protein, partial [Acidilobaceae archaeon]
MRCVAARSKLLLEFPGLEVLDSVTLPARESAVIVVDMQNDFVKPGGRLRVPTAEATIPSISRLLASARSRGVR